jgi:hypothetical protein
MYDSIFLMRLIPGCIVLEIHEGHKFPKRDKKVRETGAITGLKKKVKVVILVAVANAGRWKMEVYASWILY